MVTFDAQGYGHSGAAVAAKDAQRSVGLPHVS